MKYESFDFTNPLGPEWYTNPSLPWHPDTEIYKSYPISYKSGDLYGPGISYLNRSVFGPGNIAFWWKKSSSLSSFSDLYFIIDNNTPYIYTNLTFGWEKKTYPIGEGMHNISWVFSLSDYDRRTNQPGMVAAWIDDIDLYLKINSVICAIETCNTTYTYSRNIAYVKPSEDISNYYWVIKGGTLLSNPPYNNTIYWRAGKDPIVKIELNVINKNGYSVSCNKEIPVLKRNTIYVDINATNSSSDVYSTIKQAINNVSDYGEIIVLKGCYVEDVTIDKPLILRSNFKEHTIIKGINNIIRIINADNVVIKNLSLEGGKNGIYLFNSNNSSIDNNKIYNCTDDGILTENSRNLTLKDNSIYNCTNRGIYLFLDNGSIAVNNTINHCVSYGIFVNSSNFTNLINNMVAKGIIGIYLKKSKQCELKNNLIDDSSDTGIYLNDSYYNKVDSNNINNTIWGISLFNSDNNNINSSNKFLGNKYNLGIYKCGENNEYPEDLIK